MIGKVFKFSLYLMAFLSLTILLFSSFVEKFIGHQYKGISNLLIILCLVPVFSAIGGVAGQMGLIAYIDSAKAKKTFQNIYVIAGLLLFVRSLFLLIYFKQKVQVSRFYQQKCL